MANADGAKIDRGYRRELPSIAVPLHVILALGKQIRNVGRNRTVVQGRSQGLRQTRRLKLKAFDQRSVWSSQLQGAERCASDQPNAYLTFKTDDPVLVSAFERWNPDYWEARLWGKQSTQ